MPAPLTQLLAFRRPTVKADSILIDCLTDGLPFRLQLTLGLYRQLSAAIEQAKFEATAPAHPVRTHLPECADAFELAWDELRAGSTESIESLSERLGLGPQSLGNWLRKNHLVHWLKLKRVRSGKASLDERAELGLPLFNPSAKR